MDDTSFNRTLIIILLSAITEWCLSTDVLTLRERVLVIWLLITKDSYIKKNRKEEEKIMSLVRIILLSDLSRRPQKDFRSWFV